MEYYGFEFIFRVVYVIIYFHNQLYLMYPDLMNVTYPSGEVKAIQIESRYQTHIIYRYSDLL